MSQPLIWVFWRSVVLYLWEAPWEPPIINSISDTCPTLVCLHFTSESVSELKPLWNLKIDLLLCCHALHIVSIHAAIWTAKRSCCWLCRCFQWRGWATRIQRSCSEKSHKMFELMTLVHLPSSSYVLPYMWTLLSFHSFQVFVYYGMVKPLPIMLGKAPGKPISPATHPTHLMPYPT